MKPFHSAYLAVPPGSYLHGDHRTAVEVADSPQIADAPRVLLMEQHVLDVPTDLVPVQKVQPLLASHRLHVARTHARLHRGGSVLADRAEGAEQHKAGHRDACEQSELRSERDHTDHADEEGPEVAARGSPERFGVAKLGVRGERRERERV